MYIQSSLKYSVTVDKYLESWNIRLISLLEVLKDYFLLLLNLSWIEA